MYLLIYDFFRILLLLSLILMMIKTYSEPKQEFKWAIYLLYLPFVIYFGLLDDVIGFSYLSFSTIYWFQASLILIFLCISAVVAIKSLDSTTLKFCFVMPVVSCIYILILNYMYWDAVFGLFFMGVM